MMLSIIIPVYNVEKYIEKCLQSILGEIAKTEDVEILLIDDGSTDRSREKYSRFTDEKLKIYIQCNKGVSAARNYGLAQSSGKWILFVDADDFLVPGWYGIMKEYFSKNVDLIIFNRNIPDIINRIELLYNLFDIKQDVKFLAGVWSKLYRRRTLSTQNRCFVRELINGEDMLFNADIIINTDKIVFCRESIYCFRVNGVSSTKRFDAKIIESDRIFHEILGRILEETKFEEEEKSYIREGCLKNAVFALTQRFSYINSYKEARKYFALFSEKPYSDIYVNGVESRKDFIILCIRKGYYWFAYLLCNMQKRLKYRRQKEYITMI